MSEDDAKRYIEYFQKGMMTEGTEHRFDHSFALKWLEQSRTIREEMARREAPQHYKSLVREFEAEMASYVPKTKYDTFEANAIFSGVLKLVDEACGAWDVKLNRPVVLAASTALDITPLALPSSDVHHLFAGLGTYSFCNYWSKMWSETFNCLSEAHGTVQMDRPKVRSALMANPHLVLLPLTMTLYYAANSTLVGYGPLMQRSALRMELLTAMEVFAVGHEYGHFFLEEGTGHIGDVPEDERSTAEEHFADAIGYLLCRAYGNKHNNWSAFCGAATLLFFRSVELCELVRERVGGAPIPKTSTVASHPPTKARVKRVCDLAGIYTAPDQRPTVTGYLAETALICDVVEEAVLASVDEFKRHEAG
ncbi:hypothetical protein WME90_33040 [Sorangium sp. So ce375]|uniref:hypothetical protein n=1 Tax=Sorangium sp. So ce375 TaxID=3133306 RepID=UPI003F5C87B7